MPWADSWLSLILGHDSSGREDVSGRALPFKRITAGCLLLRCCWCVAGKLAARSQKVAFYMLHKVGGGKLVHPGDRVALIFRPDEPAQFATAFYGCIFAAVIPVAIEPPITKEVSIK